MNTVQCIPFSGYHPVDGMDALDAMENRETSWRPIFDRHETSRWALFGRRCRSAFGSFQRLHDRQRNRHETPWHSSSANVNLAALRNQIFTFDIETVL